MNQEKYFLFGGAIGLKNAKNPINVFRDKKNNTIFEISDDKSTVNNNLIITDGFKCPLSSILRHDVLYSAYPFLKNISVYFIDKEIHPLYKHLESKFAFEFIYDLQNVRNTNNYYINVFFEFKKPKTNESLSGIHGKPTIQGRESYNLLRRGLCAEAQHAIQGFEWGETERGYEGEIERTEDTIRNLENSIRYVAQNDPHRLAQEYVLRWFIENKENISEFNYLSNYYEIQSRLSVSRISLTAKERVQNPPNELKSNIQFSKGGSLDTNKLIPKHMSKNIQPRCELGMKVESLIFDKEKYSSKESQEWASSHHYSNTKVDEKPNSYRLRQEDPSKFKKGSFRTIPFNKHIKAVVGCPKNNDEKLEEGGVPDKLKIVVVNNSNSAYDKTAQKFLLEYLKNLNKSGLNKFISFLVKSKQTLKDFETVFYLNAHYHPSHTDKFYTNKIRYYKTVEEAYQDALDSDDEHPTFIRTFKKNNIQTYIVAPEFDLFGGYIEEKYDSEGKLKKEVTDQAIEELKKELFVNQEYQNVESPNGGIDKIMEDGGYVNLMETGENLDKVIDHIYHDHHKTYAFINRLEKDYKSGKVSAISLSNDILALWKNDMSEHFKEEEEDLFPKITGLGDKIDDDIKHLLEEHIEIEFLVNKIRGDRNNKDRVKEFIENVKHHIQEEETLFSQFENDKYWLQEDLVEKGLTDKETIEELAKENHIPQESVMKNIQKGLAIERKNAENATEASEIAVDHLEEDIHHYDDTILAIGGEIKRDKPKEMDALANYIMGGNKIPAKFITRKQISEFFKEEIVYTLSDDQQERIKDVKMLGFIYGGKRIPLEEVNNWVATGVTDINDPSSIRILTRKVNERLKNINDNLNLGTVPNFIISYNSEYSEFIDLKAEYMDSVNRASEKINELKSLLADEGLKKKV